MCIRDSTYTANDGTQRQSNEITAFRVIFLDRNNESNNTDSNFSQDMNNQQQANTSNEFDNQPQISNENDVDDAEELPW